MLYLLDANVLITANNQYYPVDRVPEYWDWLHHVCSNGHVKLPVEIYEEVKAGPAEERDTLFAWLQQEDIKKAMVLSGAANLTHVRHIIAKGYASDLTDAEVEQIGRDPFLIAHAFADRGSRCVVTVETSQPSKQRQNRKIPDVCKAMGVRWCDPLTFGLDLGFSTNWKAKVGA
jgi:hypothetical protein